jgi:hypothetical protein
MAMAKKTPVQLEADIAAVLGSGDAKTLSGMRQMLEHYAELASLGRRRESHQSASPQAPAAA